MYSSYLEVPWYLDLWRSWLDMFRDGWVGVSYGLLVGLAVLSVGLLVLYGIYRAADQLFTPQEEGLGRVLDKWIVAGHYETRYATGTAWVDGKVTMVQTPYEAWVPPQPQVKVGLSDGNGEDVFDVGSSDYDHVEKNASVRITFQRGRLSGIVYLKSYKLA